MAGEPESPSTTTALIRTIPLEDGPPLEPGTYRISSEGRTGSDPIVWSIVDFTIEIPEGLIGHTGHYLETTEDVQGGARFGFLPTACRRDLRRSVRGRTWLDASGGAEARRS